MLRLPWASSRRRNCRADEGQPVVARPRIVKPYEPKLAPAGVGPQAEHVQATEVSEPGLMEEYDGPLALHVAMLCAEVECIFVRGSGEIESSRLGNRVVRHDIVGELEQHEVAGLHSERLQGKVLRDDTRVRVPVVAGGNDLLGGSAVAHRDAVLPGHHALHPAWASRIFQRGRSEFSPDKATGQA